MDGRVSYRPQDPEALGKEPLLRVQLVDVETGRAKEEVDLNANGGSTSARGLPSANSGLSATSSLYRRHSVRAGVAQLGHDTGHLVSSAGDGMIEFWGRFTRKGKKNIGVWASLKAIAFSSCECYAVTTDAP